MRACLIGTGHFGNNPMNLRFTFDEASSAWGGKFNCGPGAICAVLDLTPEELHPKMGDFDTKGYTNPTLMFDILDRCGAAYRRTYRGDQPCEFPKIRKGLVRIQFAGPWTKPGVPMRVRYRQTHWVAAREKGFQRGTDSAFISRETEIFDINAMCVGGWTPFTEWANKLIPWLIRELYPKADGHWWPTHAIEILNQQ
jgi:hypothetical protein